MLYRKLALAGAIGNSQEALALTYQLHPTLETLGTFFIPGGLFVNYAAFHEDPETGGFSLESLRALQEIRTLTQQAVIMAPSPLGLSLSA